MVTFLSNRIYLKQVAIIGAGLAGLISSIDLVKKGVPCLLLERKRFPFHRVCGEYISNETVGYLKSLGVYPDEFAPRPITQFQLSSIRGQSATMPLDLGGFAISRYTFDHFLLRKAISAGVEFKDNCEVQAVEFRDDRFSIKTDKGDLSADVVIGAFGKRSKLDVSMKRDFIERRSPYIGVKFHVTNANHPDQLVALHNFEGGYCGVVNVEEGLTNICYLASREQFRKYKSPLAFQENVLYENPHLQRILTNSKIVFDKPLVINEVSFATKSPLENHILMTGDAAGMITPLCGNGMAIALHSGKLAAEAVFPFVTGKVSRETMEIDYTQKWKDHFSLRLSVGRAVQKIFGSRAMSELSTRLMMHSPLLARTIMKHTHGKSF